MTGFSMMMTVFHLSIFLMSQCLLIIREMTDIRKLNGKGGGDWHIAYLVLLSLGASSLNTSVLLSQQERKITSRMNPRRSNAESLPDM